MGCSRTTIWHRLARQTGINRGRDGQTLNAGFSSWHIAVLFFCFAAGSGTVLLLCSLNYYRSNKRVTRRKIWNLQFSLLFYPNICMFLAFMLWGFIEGSLHESVTCCALCILRPVMLMWALRYLKYLQDRFFRITHELTLLRVIVYSVFIAYGWRIHAHDTDNKNSISSGILFGFLVLSSLLPSEGFDDFIYFLLSFLLSFFQFFQLMFSFGFPSLVIVILVFVQSLMLCCIPLLTLLQARFKCLQHRLITILWILIITLLDIILVIYVHLVILEREKEYLEWTCVILFLEVLKIAVVFEKRVMKRMLKVPVCNEIMFMFGAVGLVLLNSVTLTAELILKARNGERVMKDMRFIVFPSESVFVLCWLILQMHAYYYTRDS